MSTCCWLCVLAIPWCVVVASMGTCQSSTEDHCCLWVRGHHSPWALSFMGAGSSFVGTGSYLWRFVCAGCCLWVVGLIHMHYMLFMSGVLILVGRLFMGGLSVGRLFRGGLSMGWDVVHGQGGAVLCIVGSLLAGSNGARWVRHSP